MKTITELGIDCSTSWVSLFFTTKTKKEIEDLISDMRERWDGAQKTGVYETDENKFKRELALDMLKYELVGLVSTLFSTDEVLKNLLLRNAWPNFQIRIHRLKE